MVETFEESGLSFSYPANWQLEHEDGEDGWTASVNSPDGTAFLVVSLREDMPGTDEVARTALAALEAEYEGTESEPAAEVIAGRPAAGYDVRFFYVDLTNTAAVRAFGCPAGTVLVLWQYNDLEDETAGPVVAAMVKSMKFEDDGGPAGSDE